MGNLYVKPEKQGNSPYTRSGLPPPKLLKKSGSDAPAHRIHDPMSLEMHMADERVRAAGLSDAEREWRRTYLQDQNLHPDEPIHVDAVHRQLNPVRIIYRYPFDKLYLHILSPTFGPYYGTFIRKIIPKFMFIYFGISLVYYIWKYEDKNWQRKSGVGNFSLPENIRNYDDLKEKHPEILELGSNDPAKYRYFHPSFEKRAALLNIGETQRPW